VTCKIGCGTVQDSRCGSQSKYGRHVDAKAQSESKSKSLWSRVTFRRSVSDSGMEAGSSDVNAVIGGIPVSVLGQFGEVIVFMEPLIDAQVQSLFRLGMILILMLVL